MSTDKKDHIIDAAIQLFAEQGFEGTSIRDLAAKAEVNIAMVNYYFGSKDKLFEAIIEQRSGYLKEKLEEILLNNSISDVQKMDQVIEHFVNRILSNYHYHRLIHQELMLQQREGTHTRIVEHFTKNADVIKTIIDQGIKKKSFKKVDAELTIASLIGTINQVMLSKSMCSIMVHKDKKINPYTDEVFKKRLVTHLKQIMHAHLLN